MNACAVCGGVRPEDELILLRGFRAVSDFADVCRDCYGSVGARGPKPPGETVSCTNYVEHRDAHRWRTDRWSCDLCHPA